MRNKKKNKNSNKNNTKKKTKKKKDKKKPKINNGNESTESEDVGNKDLTIYKQIIQRFH